MVVKERRYDIDWLRVIAILAVYFHHIGMPFNGDDFHIMNAASSKTLDDIMVFFEQFRLPLLFLVSGTGTIFAFSKRTWTAFLKERSIRLLIPLIFGVILIVPPQIYFENIQKVDSYFQLYPNVLLNFEANHLWFIENLFVMSCFAIPLILFLKSPRSNTIKTWLEKSASKKLGLFLWVVPLIIGFIILKKFYPDDSKEITNLSSTFFYSYFFIAGMLFASTNNIWLYLKNYRGIHMVVFLISTLLFYGYYFLPSDYIEPYLTISNRWDIWYFVCALVSWSVVLTLLGYGQLWFNKKSKLLQKSNEAIYPFYILHQTIIVVFGYYIIQLEMNITLKILLLVVTTFPVIFIIYRFLIYPFKIPRLLFGMKKNS